MAQMATEFSVCPNTFAEFVPAELTPLLPFGSCMIAAQPH
jgi:hypothetical protein